MKLIRQGAQIRLEREHNFNAWLAWHIEALRRAKKLPKLDKLFMKQKKKGQPQSWQQQHAIMASWSARVERAIAMKNQITKGNGNG